MQRAVVYRALQGHYQQPSILLGARLSTLLVTLPPLVVDNTMGSIAHKGNVNDLQSNRRHVYQVPPHLIVDNTAGGVTYNSIANEVPQFTTGGTFIMLYSFCP